jgi:hypothetical protein
MSRTFSESSLSESSVSDLVRRRTLGEASRSQPQLQSNNSSSLSYANPLLNRDSSPSCLRTWVLLVKMPQHSVWSHRLLRRPSGEREAVSNAKPLGLPSVRSGQEGVLSPAAARGQRGSFTSTAITLSVVLLAGVDGSGKSRGLLCAGGRRDHSTRIEDRAKGAATLECEGTCEFLRT